MSASSQRIEQKLWDKVGFVVSSSYRIDVLDALSDEPATPTEAASEVHDTGAHVSRAIQEMRDEGLVELLVEEDTRKGRIYAATPVGEKVNQIIQEKEIQ